MKIVACLGWKYEPQWMIDDFKKNMSWVDDFAILDCRGRDELWIHEGEYRLKLREMAAKKKADWILIASADERYEKNAGDTIRPLVEDNKNKVIYEFNLREMFTPTHYRTDGIWEKYRRRLYPLLPNQTVSYQPIQCPSMPQNADYRIEKVDVNIYHLKMIEPENRIMRTRVFKELDKTNEFQGVGYDYLADDYGAVLEKIPKGREYLPKYRKYIFKVPKKFLTLKQICPMCKQEVK